MGSHLGLLSALAGGLIALGAVGYWLLALSEGVYLGPRIVIWLYDRAAPRYDRIKNADPLDDRRYLARPLLLALDGVREPRILDVATGTGRLPVALRAEEGFAGQVIGLDSSTGMLAQAHRKLEGGPANRALVRADAGCLPFAEATFDAVTCLEALEFTRRPNETLREMARVLKPGGVLLTSCRVGRDAWYFPGRPCGRGRVEALLCRMGLEGVETERWQVYYDLVWARRSRAFRSFQS